MEILLLKNVLLNKILIGSISKFTGLNFEIDPILVCNFYITTGTYDFIGECMYKVPSHLAIGKDYERLIEDVKKEEDVVDTLYNVMTSFITDEISNYNSSLYYSSRE